MSLNSDEIAIGDDGSLRIGSQSYVPATIVGEAADLDEVVPLAGQFAFSTDTLLLKLGDGETEFGDLDTIIDATPPE